MLHNILLAMATAGQCGPAGCPAPGYPVHNPPSFWTVQQPEIRPAPAVTYFEPAPVASAPRPRLRRLTGWFGGRLVEVNGWIDAGGKVAFNEADQRDDWQRPIDDVRKRPPVAPREPEPKLATSDPPKPDSPTTDPIARPEPIQAPAIGADFTLNGVDRSKMADDKAEKYSAEGVAGRIFMTQLKEGTAVTDAENDAVKPHLTVVGTKAERQAVVDAMASCPELAAIRPLVHFRGDYEHTSPYVADIGLTSGKGKPEIIVQRPGGAVVWRQFDFDGGGKALAEAIVKSGAVRKPNPDHKIDSDPSPNNRATSDPRPGFSWIAVVCLVAIVFVFVLPSGPKQA